MRLLDLYLVLYAFNYFKWIKIPVPSFFLYWNTLLYNVYLIQYFRSKVFVLQFFPLITTHRKKKHSSFTGDLQTKRDMNDSPPFDIPPARTNWTPPWRASAGMPLGLGDLCWWKSCCFLERCLLLGMYMDLLGNSFFFFRGMFCFKVFCCPRKMLIVFHHLIVITLVLIPLLMPVKSLGS